MNAQSIQMSDSAGMPPGATRVAPPKGWFARNWKWFVPVLLIVCLALPLAILGSVFAAIRSSDAAKQSLLRARSNPLVVQKLGTPIEEGWLAAGSINVSGTSGDADLAVPISGPKAKGKIYVTAHKSAGVWSYSVMAAAIDGSDQRIDLLTDVAPGAEVPPASQGTVQPTQQTPPVEMTQTARLPLNRRTHPPPLQRLLPRRKQMSSRLRTQTWRAWSANSSSAGATRVSST
jgi:hypothetical protein